MKNSLFLVSCFLCMSGFLLPADIKRDEVMWKSAYSGQCHVVHRLSLARNMDNINDRLVSEFVMAYVHYRNGNYDHIEDIFNAIDGIIEDDLFFRDE